MKRSGAEETRKVNSFSIDSIIAGRTETSSRQFDVRPAAAQIPPLHRDSRSIPDVRLSDPSLAAAAAAGMAYGEQRDAAIRHQQHRSFFDYARYSSPSSASSYDPHAVAAHLAAAMATMTSYPGGAMDHAAGRTDPLSYSALWMHANRQHASPQSLFLPGKDY